MSDTQYVPQLPQEETALIRAWHKRGYEAARQEAASGERLVRCLGLDRTVVNRLEREHDGRLVEYVAHRLSR
ncbi:MULTISPECIES: hypothetical protein [unclassified Streptomyces]|uniref:Helix-turn-helix DNA binding domain protein n=1 Tax=Streptomyces sp. NBC_00060 TaxID=2975636 RepID=A0AAU2GRE0_9ACTN